MANPLRVRSVASAVGTAVGCSTVAAGVGTVVGCSATAVAVGSSVAVVGVSVGVETAVAALVTTTGRVALTVSPGGLHAAKLSRHSKQIVNHFDVAFMRRSNAVWETAVFPQVIASIVAKNGWRV